MKKILLLSGIIFSGILSAQNNRVSFYKEYLKKDLVKQMEKEFKYKKYPKSLLTALADTLVTNNAAPCNIEGFNNDYEDELKIKYVENLDELTKLNTNKEEINNNLCGIFGGLPEIAKAGSEEGISENGFGEVIPNDLFLIRSWGGGNFVGSTYYRIINGKIIPVNIEPKEDFFKLINKKIKQNGYNTLRWGTGSMHAGVNKKLKDGSYLISGPLYTEDHSDAYELEYKTKDFKKFTPVRVRHDENSKWITF